MKLVIPYNKIKKDSNVIIYGAGKIGRLFWESNQQTQWFHCLYVVDKQYGQKTDFPCAVDSPNKIMECDSYDYIIIALKNYMIRKEVKDDLIANGIDEKKIIYQLNWFETDDVEINKGIDDGSNNIYVALKLHGGMGDYIVFLKLYNSLIHRIPIAKVDIYGCGFPKTEKIYNSQKNIENIYNEELLSSSIQWDKYDIIFDIVYIPRVEKLNREKISRLNISLLHDLDLLVQSNQAEDICRIDANIPKTILWRLMLERARLLGLNRYTVMGSNGFFEILDKKVEICFDKNYKESYATLNIQKPFITVNFGTDKTQDGKPQIKLWPKDYHEKLNGLIKKKYPNINIVQLGAVDADLLGNVDRYVLGKDLDVVKYIIKDALFHIDCEGGLVHMASQLGTKCFVMFGPTPMWFYGYEQNCNIKSDICGECYCLTENWMTNCIKYDKPECMYSIKPIDVFSKIEEYLDENQANN